MFSIKSLATAIAAVTIAAAPIATMPAMAQQAAAPADISDSELNAFAGAYKEVVAIEAEFGARLQGVTDEAEQQAIVSEAQSEMTQAVEEAPDIEVDRYIEILQIVQVDPDLQAKLSEKLQN